MTIDRTTKSLLAIITVLLAVMAFRPTILPALARDGRRDQRNGPTVVPGERGIYIVEDGRIFRFVETLGKPTNIGYYGPNVEPRSKPKE